MEQVNHSSWLGTAKKRRLLNLTIAYEGPFRGSLWVYHGLGQDSVGPEEVAGHILSLARVTPRPTPECLRP